MYRQHFYTFISNTRLKLAKNEAIDKQHPDTERLKFKNYLHSSSTLSTKNNRAFSKKKKKNGVCFHEIIWLIVVKMKMKIKDRLHRYGIIESRSRHGHKYSK